ncbi:MULTISPECIES: hypothetical protein [Flavobacterium]|uniref:Uncharacterized protein n=1 Tax=Flavobacterium gawalongense TaxID=2594432 RepID=A0A553BL12_9FLAO|nr:hypothetical protein [Flavobacterium gawalongense]TRX00440.1 hypothetical protein FNW33_12090 [Flavobacterium gawalongense]TRX05013.1 hypothetical protein FNW12_11900 [Flavobacterium gawalongense]TRX08931.1 hypothetical protein FNW11_10325 [Flavobacterium gawalongense]TRX10082.1 hypothetical protein FNW10_10475 [Flavobacterium gawalongense]TRX26885.1 hypothetical protein FNW38_09835 [Flavobacterium gawalongense]
MSRLDKTSNLPLFQKAELIYQLVESLVASLPEEDAYIQDTKHLMREDAMIITAKIAGAEGGDLYSIRMQNAAIIREHAMHLYVHVGSLRLHKNFKELEYVQLIRKELNDFRLLFIEWVESFDTNNHIWDDWGLFNPPGAIPPSQQDTATDNDFDLNTFFEDDEE